MKGLFITLFVFALIVTIGYMNKNNYKDCVKEQITFCYENGYNNCENTAIDHCNFMKK